MTLSVEVPVLATERLVLRGHQLDDYAASAAMWAEPEVVAHISGTPSSGEQSWSRLLRYRGHWSMLGFGYWVVTDKADGAFLGEVGFADYHRTTSPSLAGRPEAGWVFLTAAHGRGYATEAVTEMLRWADAHLEAPHTACMIEPTHEPSIAVARKTGFSNPVLGSYGEHEALFLERPRQYG